jgi:hypothetical protein
MTENAELDKLKGVVAKLSTDQLKALVIQTYSDPRDLASIVFASCLAELELRMPGDDFIKFCETME